MILLKLIYRFDVTDYNLFSTLSTNSASIHQFIGANVNNNAARVLNVEGSNKCNVLNSVSLGVSLLLLIEPVS